MLQTFLKNKQNLLIVAVVVFVLLLAVVPILIHVINDNDDGLSDTPNTGETISGTYSMELQNAGASEYIFDGNKVTNIYNGNTVEYTYVLAIENGVKVIKLTTMGEGGELKTTTHEFKTGKFGETPIIIINDSIYYLKQ